MNIDVARGLRAALDGAIELAVKRGTDQVDVLAMAKGQADDALAELDAVISDAEKELDN